MSTGRKKKSGKAGNTGLSGELAVLCGKLTGILSAGLAGVDVRRVVMMNIPYVIVAYMADKAAWAYRHCAGDSFIAKAGALFLDFNRAFENPLPSIHFRIWRQVLPERCL